MDAHLDAFRDACIEYGGKGNVQCYDADHLEAARKAHSAATLLADDAHHWSVWHSWQAEVDYWAERITAHQTRVEESLR